MRAIVLEMPPHWIEERRRHGLDRRDEVWDGVLHMVPPPGLAHQKFAGLLEPVVTAIAHKIGLDVTRETGIFATSTMDNFRVPDLVVASPVHQSERGVERRAEIAIEILSPHDESRDKLPFYAMCGVREVWLIDPKPREFEILWLDDQYASVRSESRVLGVTLATIDGPKLRSAHADGVAEI
jgi:Uma2 family endonuclease